MRAIINLKIFEYVDVIIDILPYITSILCAIIAGFVSFSLAHKQTQSAIVELNKKYKLDFEQYQKQDLYKMRKEVIFKTLSLFDDYISWLTVEGIKPTRKQDCSSSEFTFRARGAYNELCVTVENPKLIDLFADVFFRQSPCPLRVLADFRKEARKELGLSNIDFPGEAAYIGTISTEDLMIKEIEEAAVSYHERTGV